MLAVAILGGVVSLVVLIVSVAGGSTQGMAASVFPCILAVALGIVGGRRFRRKDLGG